jgi:hypothetical protein
MTSKFIFVLSALVDGDFSIFRGGGKFEDTKGVIRSRKSNG